MLITTFDQAISLFPLAFVAGAIISVTCAVLGVLVILRRVVFIGITLTEVAAFGIALAMVLGWPPFLGAALLTSAAAIYVAHPLRERWLPRDAILGGIFVGAAALSVLLVAGSGFGLHDIQSLLYGDLILSNKRDMIMVAAVLLPALALLLVCLRPILYAMLDGDYARVVGIRVRTWDTLFFLALSLAVAAASKLGGALLIFAYLVVLPALALSLSRRLTVVLVIAAGLNLLATVVGLLFSIATDLPTNPTIIATTVALFAVISSFAAGLALWRRQCRRQAL